MKCYGLRAYGTNPQVWGGDDPLCAHEWGDEGKRTAGRNDLGRDLTGSGGHYKEDGPRFAAASSGARCTRCTAWRGELGSESHPEQYVANLVAVFREVRRVLHPSGVCIVNLGDSYAGSGKGPTGHNGIGDQAERQGFSSRATRAKGGLQSGTATVDMSFGGKAAAGYKAKDLMQMPFKVAEALRQDGWYLRSTMCWLKRSSMPESVLDRPSNALEWLFLFSKAPRYFWDHESIRQTAIHEGRLVKATGLDSKHGRSGDEVNGRETAKGFTTHDTLVSGRAFRNTDPFRISLDTAIADARADLAQLEAMRATGGVLCDDDGLPLAVDINPQGYADAHFATYPPALVVPFVKAGSSERGACPRCLAPWGRVGTRPASVLGEAVRVSRERAGLTREGLAERTGKGANNVWDWEVGGHIPTGRNWERLAAALDLGVTRDQFIAQAEYIVTGSQDGPKRQASDADPLINRPYTERMRRLPPLERGWQPSCACAAGEPRACVVLDPFAGSGTTLLVASRLGRDAVGIELSPEYARLAQARLDDDAPMFERAEVETDDYAPLALFGMEAG